MPHTSPQPARRDRERRRDLGLPVFELYQIAYVRHALPRLGLAKGEHGTIVHVVHKPRTAYLLEFVNKDGTTRAEEFLTPDQLAATPPRP